SNNAVSLNTEIMPQSERRTAIMRSEVRTLAAGELTTTRDPRERLLRILIWPPPAAVDRTADRAGAGVVQGLCGTRWQSVLFSPDGCCISVTTRSAARSVR